MERKRSQTKCMRLARKQINADKLNLEMKIDELLIKQAKLESMRNESKNLKSFYDKMVCFTDKVLYSKISLKKLLKRLYHHNLFSKNRESIVKTIEEQKQIVLKEEMNLHIFKRNMNAVCKFNNHNENKICIFCI